MFTFRAMFHISSCLIQSHFVEEEVNFILGLSGRRSNRSTKEQQIRATFQESIERGANGINRYWKKNGKQLINQIRLRCKSTAHISTGLAQRNWVFTNSTKKITQKKCMISQIHKSKLRCVREKRESANTTQDNNFNQRIIQQKCKRK